MPRPGPIDNGDRLGLEASRRASKDSLAEEYEESIKSKIADIKNIGGKGGGSITAALFLKHFVDKAKWAHLDIAGPVWDDAKGATGYGAKVLARWVADSGK